MPNRKCIATLIITLIAILSACGESKSEKARHSENELAFTDLQSLFSPTVIALANGGAYVTSFASPVWYVQGKDAVIVKGLPSSSEVDEITPTADGGAYLTTYGKGVWHLDADTATKLNEVSALSLAKASPAINNKERALFVLWQHESARRIAAVAEAAEARLGRHDDGNR